MVRRKGVLTVEKFVNGLLALGGVSLLLISLVKVFFNYQSYITINTLREFFLAPLLTIGFLPFIYGLVVFMMYEWVFTLLLLNRERSSFNAAKREIISDYRFNLSELREFAHNNAFKIRNTDSESEVLELIRKAQANKKTRE